MIARQISDKNQRIRSGQTLIAAASETILGAILRYVAFPEGTYDVHYISEGGGYLGIPHGADARRHLAAMAMTIPEDAPGLESSILVSGTNLTAWSHKWRITTPSSKRKWLHDRGIPSCNPDGSTTWNSVILDVTHLMQAQEDLAHNREFLAYSQRLETVGRLTAGVAHEFNNLMAVIMGNIEMALDKERVPENEARAYLQEALAALQRGARQTSDLLTFGGKAKLDPRVTTFNQILESLRSMLRTTIPESIEVDIDLCEDPWATKLDSTQLGVAILNIVINARAALQPGGKIRMVTENATLAVGEHCDIPAGDYVRLTVSDDGVGMSPEVLSKAIDPYSTTKPVGKGTGLGLSVVHGFVKQSGGELEIESVEGDGTNERLWFRRVPDDEEVPSAALVQNDRATGVEAHDVVLLVEDDPEVRAILSRQLSVLGFRVRTSADGQDALDTLRRDDTIRLVLSDIVMPGTIEGGTLAEIVAREHPSIPVILPTGSPGDEVAAELLCPVLSKPIGTRELGAALRRHLHRSFSNETK